MPSSTKPVDIPEDEQWRLINESGVLKKVDSPSEPELPLGEGICAFRPPHTTPTLILSQEIFNALLLITPCSFLLLLMDILIYQQYGQDPNLKTVVERMIQGVPILSIFVFYSKVSTEMLTRYLAASRYKRDQRMQLLLFLLGTAAGSRMLFLIKRGSYLVNIQQCPPLVTVWVYIVIQLDLGLAVLNLAMVGTFCWWKGLDLFK
ncbi:hypothetical protein C8R44DRAFT_615137 [Mycena epipterygia]|nr:hypothetical protein C8R44DRAFT_615137 [Mycena epipterygia]